MKKLSMISSMFFAAGMVLLPLVSQAQVTFVSPANPMAPCRIAIQGNLSYGMTDSSAEGSAPGSSAVTNLQQFLNSNGYLKVSPTGYFGSLTLAAVKAFQGENGVPATGYVGPLTVAAADKYPCSGTLGTSSGTSGGSGISPASGMINIVSPVAGATLNRGSYQNITWTQTNPSSIPSGAVVVGSTTIPQNQNSYDVALIENPPQCSGGQVCPMYMLAPFPIAYNVSARGNYQVSWPWIVATSTSNSPSTGAPYSGSPTIPDGQYKIEVCVSVAISVAGSTTTVTTSTNTDTNCSQGGSFTIAN